MEDSGGVLGSTELDGLVLLLRLTGEPPHLEGDLLSRDKAKGSFRVKEIVYSVV